jgi:hypothetical protein
LTPLEEGLVRTIDYFRAVLGGSAPQPLTRAAAEAYAAARLSGEAALSHQRQAADFERLRA